MSSLSLLVFLPAVAVAGGIGYVVADEYADELERYYNFVENIFWVAEIFFVISWFLLLSQLGIGGLIVGIGGALAIGAYYYFDER